MVIDISRRLIGLWGDSFVGYRLDDYKIQNESNLYQQQHIQHDEMQHLAIRIAPIIVEGAVLRENGLICVFFITINLSFRN